jgi:hypothetical protein
VPADPGRSARPAAGAHDDGQARDPLSPASGRRRRDRATLWQDSSFFQDSFFGADNRPKPAAAQRLRRAAARRRASCARPTGVSAGAGDDPAGVVADAAPACCGIDRAIARMTAASASVVTPLDPQQVLAALDAAGLRGDGRILQLNSYENRVFQVLLEDGRAVVAKFYRPGRWSDAQILEEHDFALELAEAEVPVVPPLVLHPAADAAAPAGRPADAGLLPRRRAGSLHAARRPPDPPAARLRPAAPGRTGCAPGRRSARSLGRVEPLDQRVLGVDLEDGLALRRLLPGLLEHARQVAAHVAFVHHDAGGVSTSRVVTRTSLARSFSDFFSARAAA